MNARTKLAALAGGAVMALAGPTAALAATATVDMGLPTASQKTFNTKYFADVNDFFPHGVTIHAGDTVKFVPTGFHSVDLPAKGGKPIAAIVPTGQKAANANDAAGNPFWFNGQDRLGFNTALVKGLFGKHVTYTGAATIESGLPLASHPKAFTVMFKKPGSFTYYCDLHPGMKGTVKVLPGATKAAAIPTDKAIKKQVARDLALVKKLGSAKAPENTVDVGEAGAYGTEVFGFVPGKVTVPTGTTLTFRMTPKSFETHTATTGPGNPEKEPKSYLGTLAAGFQGTAFDPAGVYPSDPPGTAVGLTPTTHGNGFWNSGGIDAVSASPLPTSNSVTFSAPGTYEFYCLIHPFMHGTVTVT